VWTRLTDKTVSSRMYAGPDGSLRHWRREEVLARSGSTCAERQNRLPEEVGQRCGGVPSVFRDCLTGDGGSFASVAECAAACPWHGLI